MNLAQAYYSLDFLLLTQLIKAAINTGFLPNLISVIMLSFVVFFGVKVKAFEGTPEKGSFYVIVTYLIHLFSINIALLYTAGIKATSLSLIYGTIIYVLVFITSRSFTKPKNNVNFVWKDDILNVPNKYHKVLWFFVVIFVLIVPTYLLQNWIFHLINR